MEKKILFATLFLKNGAAVKSTTDYSILGEACEIAKIYNDSGIDKIIVRDLSDNQDEQKATMRKLRELIRIFEVPVYGSGRIKTTEDIKRLLYAGCDKVIINCSVIDPTPLIIESVKRFGIDKLTISLDNVDALFKQRSLLESQFVEIFVKNEDIIDDISNLTSMPFIPVVKSNNPEDYSKFLKMPNVIGISGQLLNNIQTDVMVLKNYLSDEGISVKRFLPSLNWEDFNINCNSLMPVITQDYMTGEVIQFGYMNKSAFKQSITYSRMYYYNDVTKEVYMQGEDTDKFQYIKSFTLDKQRASLLARVSQFDSTFTQETFSEFSEEIVRKEFINKNVYHIVEDLYQRIKEESLDPRPGTNMGDTILNGTDDLLKRCAQEWCEIILAIKNDDDESVRANITNLLYHMMFVMVGNDLRWSDVMSELLRR